MPHLLLGPFPDEDRISLTGAQAHHLASVLRRQDESEVTYTDGEGTSGRGRLSAEHVVRGTEVRTEPEPVFELAVAPPASRDRARFLVEKLAELSVARLTWLRTDHGEGRPPAIEKATLWAAAALEQSRGAWLMRVEPETVVAVDLPDRFVFLDGSGEQDGALSPSVAVGPEGGWSDRERESRSLRTLGARVLRVETAAIMAAALAVSGSSGR